MCLVAPHLVFKSVSLFKAAGESASSKNPHQFKTTIKYKSKISSKLVSVSDYFHLFAVNTSVSQF